ncbi:ComEC/Rec2 family competence protein [Marinilabilia rubra]|uniref:Competence protein ComEC n=1 Tax=Marinilabilia rubra TaxID=2162893 RepID=A0A2U2B4L9_9BACT|nr:ComEC/Rec2 family competence protein [Marinilabilia rubra]PWD98005.1 competence protein ComEC [Marinilabilia rubra]
MSLKQLIKSIPFVRFSLALGMGIFLAEKLEKADLQTALIIFGVVAVFLLLTLLVPFVFQKYTFRWLAGCFFFFFLLLTGIAITLSSGVRRFDGECEITAKARVVEGDISLSGYYIFVVDPLKYSTRSQFRCGNDELWQIIVEPKDSFLVIPASPGNIVSFRTNLSGHSDNTNPESFDYGKYLFRQGISATGFVLAEDFQVVEKTGMAGIMGAIKRTRNKVYDIYRENGIADEELQVLSALTLGMRQVLDDEVKSWFIHSGAIHVLAVSGLHVGIIFVFVNWFLSLFLSRRSILKVIFVILVLVFYAILTGGAPSVFRAVVMLSVIQIGIYAQRPGNIYNLLGLSAFIILLIQPMALFHPGFWLSHMAVAGIVTFYPLFSKLYAGKNVFIRSLGDLVAVSLSAQLGTFPLSLFLFRAFPSWFLLSNLFILPLVAPVLILAKLLVFASSQSFLASVFAGVLNELLRFMIEVVKWLNSLPAAYLQGIWLSGATMFLFYLVLTSLTMWHNFKIRLFLKSCLAGLLLILLILNIEYWGKRNTDAFVVFDSGRKPLIGCIVSGQASLFSDDETTERQMNFICSGFFSRYSINMQRQKLFHSSDGGSQVSSFYALGGYYLGVGDVDVDHIKIKSSVKNKILGVIILGDLKGDIKKFLNTIGKPTVILTDACPPWSKGRRLSTLKSSGVEIYDVSQSGAYVSLAVPLSLDTFFN